MKGQASGIFANIELAHRRKRNLRLFLTVLALFVSLFVVWELKVTGISMAGDANVSDSNADVETSAQWESTIPDLGEDWLENTAAIAESQVGYTESTLNFIMDEDGETPLGYTRYGAWYGSPYSEWDSLFAAFCLSYGGVSSPSLQHSSSAYSWATALSSEGLLMNPSGYEPKVGDLAFFDEDGDEREDRVAVVVDTASDGTLTYVQGDKDDEVKRFASTSSQAYAPISFGQTPQNPVIEEAQLAAEQEAAEQEAAEAEAAEGEAAAGEEAGEKAEGDDASKDSDSKSSSDSSAKKDEEELSPAAAANAKTTDPDKTTIAVCAEFDESSDSLPQSVNVSLLKDGDFENPVETIALSAADNWEGAFANVDLYDSNEEAVRYNVVQDAVDGYDSEIAVATVSADVLDSASKTKVSLADVAKSAEDAPAESAGVSTVEEATVAASEEGGSLSSDRAGLFLLSYSAAAYASEGTRAADPTVPLTITKDWSDGDDAHAGESVTVDVHVTYEDGSAWDSTTTISSGDDWEKIVNVPANISIETCTVTERAVDGYDSYVEDVDIDATDVWIPVQPNAVKDRETYALVYKPTYSSSYYALTDAGNGALSSDWVTMGANTVIYDGVSYHDYLTGVSDSAQWQWLSVAAQGYPGRYVLRNASTSNYVHEKVKASYTYAGTVYTYSFDSSSTGGMPLLYSSGKTLMSTTSHYMQNYSNATTSASSATAYTFYKKIRATSKMSTTVHNRRTAAATESATSVSVEKVWLDENGNVDNASHADDSVTLHLTDVENGGAAVSGAAPVTLSAGNDWQAENVWQNLVEGTYSVREDSVAGYNATVESVQNRKTIWVPVDEFEHGGLYAIVDTTTNKFLQAPDQNVGSATTSSGYLKKVADASSVRVSGDQLSFGGYAYADYIEDADTPSSAQWMASEQGDGFGLRSSSMNFTKGGWMRVHPDNMCLSVEAASDATAGVFTYDSSTKRLYADGYYYGLGTSSSYSTYYGYGKTTKSFQLYKRVTLVERSFTVTNTPVVTQSGEAPGVDVEHNKYIDALRDGVKNPDTTMASGTDLTDLYRLYLDAGPVDIDEPIDLLLVLDDSGSMATKTSLNGTTMTRTEALEKILCGSNGVISKFLSSNAGNRVAMVSFAGHTPIYDDTYEDDTMTLLNWTKRAPSSLSLFSTGGTNYSAGLLEAENLFGKSNTGNKKVMVFLSDGVPTFYVDTQGVRHGHGGSDKGNSTLCIEPSMESFDRFRQAYPDVITYTVGFSEDISGDVGNVSTSPAVLRYYAEMGSGSFIQAKNADTLNEQISKLILGGGLLTNASISDALTDAVDLYDAQPDYKVVMQKVVNGQTTGSEVVLYENGQATKQYVDEADNDQTKDIVTGVSYNAASRTVTATFDSNYALDPEYRYTVSFNVKTTNKAYSDYANDKSNGGDGYDGMTGDADTDYSPYTARVENDTSSGHLGFRSNTTAQLNFKRGNSYYAMAYDHPVIQVSDCSFDIKKVDVDNEGKLLGGAKFSVYRKARAGETVWHVDGLEGDYCRVATDLVTQGGTVSVKHLEPGTYWVVEDASPSGYTKDATPHEITLTRDSIVVGSGDSTAVFEGNVDGHLVLRITNEPGYSLPKTGGIGNGPFTVTGAILVASSLAFGCVLARRRNERRLGRASLQRR